MLEFCSENNGKKMVFEFRFITHRFDTLRFNSISRYFRYFRCIDTALVIFQDLHIGYDVIACEEQATLCLKVKIRDQRQMVSHTMRDSQTIPNRSIMAMRSDHHVMNINQSHPCQMTILIF